MTGRVWAVPRLIEGLVDSSALVVPSRHDRALRRSVHYLYHLPLHLTQRLLQGHGRLRCLFPGMLF